MSLLHKGAFTLLLGFYCYNTYAEGNITGNVLGYSGKSIAQCNVQVIGTNLTADTDSTGDFAIKDIPEGKYDIVFTAIHYKSDTIRDVRITNESVSLNRILLKKEEELVKVEVIGSRYNNTDKDLLSLIRSKNEVISGISAEQLSKGQDRDAAEAVKRIPGVSVYDDRFIIVRGASQRYNCTWLNGVTAASSEPDKKAFSFDIVPTSFIDQILVYKTPSADLPGDFAGGMTKVVTRTATVGHQFQMDINGSYRQGSTLQTLQFTEGSKTNILGFDNGYRSIPNNVPAIIVNSNADLTKSFKNTWVLHNKQAAPDIRFTAAYANSVKLGKARLSSITGISYANENTLYKVDQYDYTTALATVIAEEPSFAFKSVQSTNTVKIGGIQNFALTIGPKSRFEFKTLFSQIGKDQTVIRTGTEEDANNAYYRFSYQSKTLLSSQLEYTFSGLSSKDRLSCIAGYSLNKRSDPDLRQITYQYPPDTFLRSNIPPGSGQIDITEGATRFFSALKENIYTFSPEYEHKFKIRKQQLSIKLGSYIEYKQRTVTSRTFGYTLPVTSIRRRMTGIPVDKIFSDENIDAMDTFNGQNKPAGFRIQESTNTSDSYKGQTTLLAPFIKTELNVWDKWFISVGLRLEDNTQNLQTIVGIDSLNIDNHIVHLLPSTNIKYQLSGKSVFRFAYGKTVNRPEFREWAPFLYYDYELLALSHGSLFPSIDHKTGYVLKTATIDNFNIKYEYYPSNSEMINFGVFYKHFLNPIEQISEAREHRTGVSKETTFHNAEAATSYGIETEIWKNLGFLGDIFGTSFMQHVSIIANASLIKSRVSNLDSNYKARPLQGQAPYLINAGLYYTGKNANKAWQVSILYNVIGPSIFIAGGTDGPHTAAGPSIGELSRNLLDITVRKNINSHISVYAGIKDLLNQPVRFVEDTNQDGKFTNEDKDITFYKRGSYYSIGVKVLL